MTSTQHFPNANFFRAKILDLSQRVSALHIGGAFSCIDIIHALYFNVLRAEDKFIMSKGHSAIAQYVILNHLGLLTDQDIINYATCNGRLSVHPVLGTPGIVASTGSLGHGMAIAAGLSYARSKLRKSDARVYVLLSDGELQEGSTWEAIMVASNLCLDQLVIIIDHNGYQSFGKTSDTHPKFYPMIEKFESFGCHTIRINGHNEKETIKSLTSPSEDGKPVVIIADTVKGKGVSFMENQPVWHYRSPNKQEYDLAISEILSEQL